MAFLGRTKTEKVNSMTNDNFFVCEFMVFYGIFNKKVKKVANHLRLPCLFRRSIERIQALISSEDMGLARVTEISGLDDEMYGWTEQQPPLPHCQPSS